MESVPYSKPNSTPYLHTKFKETGFPGLIRMRVPVCVREREMRVPSEYGERGNIWSSGKGGRAVVDNGD
jgi:hypothetical protein